jgi:hypothetical protein
MKITVQTDDLGKLQKVASSKCDIVRFGSEFCELKIPSLKRLQNAYKTTIDEGKEFIYVTPKVSNLGLTNVRKQLKFLTDVEAGIVVNDLGILNILHNTPNLKLYLGRQLVYIAARCPWFTFEREGWLERQKLEKTYYQTSLNFEPMINFLKEYNLWNVDIDWIPRCFPHLDFLVKKGLHLSAYLHLVPVAITRKCHMARFLGETSYKDCTKQCNDRSFLLKQKTIELELFLCGNTIFRIIQPIKEEIKKLKNKINEVIILVNPITNIENQVAINEVISNLQL